MKSRTSRRAANRRRFLRGVAAAGGATALTAVTATGLIDMPAEHSRPAQGSPEPATRGYHETPHIRAYYRALRS